MASSAADDIEDDASDEETAMIEGNDDAGDESDGDDDEDHDELDEIVPADRGALEQLGEDAMMLIC